MTQTFDEHQFDDATNEPFMRVVVGATDDLSLAILATAYQERLMEALLKSKRPNWSKPNDPLKIAGLSLSLGVTAKWAYALGFIDDRLLELCQMFSSVRNNAAHLNYGAEFSFADQHNSDKIGRAYDKYAPTNIQQFCESQIAPGTEESRAKFFAMSAAAVGAFLFELTRDT